MKPRASDKGKKGRRKAQTEKKVFLNFSISLLFETESGWGVLKKEGVKDRSAKPRAALLVLLRSRQLPAFNGWRCAFSSGPEQRGFRIGAGRHRSPWFTVRLPELRRLRETDRLESNISTDLYWLATRNSRVGSTNSQAVWRKQMEVSDRCGTADLW